MTISLLKDAFSKAAKAHRRKDAVSFIRNGRMECRISYGALEEDANRLAHYLLNSGIKKGDRIIFFLEKSLFTVIAHLAVQKIGAVGVPLNPGFKKSEMVYFIRDARPRLVICNTETDGMILGIDPKVSMITLDPQRPYGTIDFFRSASKDPPDVDIDEKDPGLIIYTSGTTGKPKGAVLTQKNLICDAQNILSAWEISESDVLCHALPLFHVHGLCFALHTALIAGTYVLLMDTFSPKTVIDVLAGGIDGRLPSVFMAVPSMYSKMMDYSGNEMPDFGHMRLWTSGSAPLPASDFSRIRLVFGKEPVEREGMTETGMNFTNPLKGKRKPGSIGVPMPGLAVRIVNPRTLKGVISGEIGEIWLRGPCVTPGYWQKPEETAKAFFDGWFRTGDLGKMDEDGYYVITDRIKHIIISGGENISPKEVESVINQHEGVIESSVVGIFDEKWGEKVVAAVVVKPGEKIAASVIQGHCRTHLHNWKCPKEIVFVEALPRNTMGKVLKEAVKKLFDKPDKSP